MKSVSYEEFQNTMRKLGAIGPEADFSLDGRVVEDYWYPDRREVAGFISYWDDGTTNYIITEHR